MASSFDFLSMFIGFIIGMIITIIIVGILYSTKTLFFEHCATGKKICGSVDYFNNPGDALADGAPLNDILFINNDNQMLYKRWLRTNDCIPEDNQIVHIENPQYCKFVTFNNLTVEGKSSIFNNPFYTIENSGEIVQTTGNCIPTQGRYINGTPLLKWDPNRIGSF